MKQVKLLFFMLIFLLAAGCNKEETQDKLENKTIEQFLNDHRSSYTIATDGFTDTALPYFFSQIVVRDYLPRVVDSYVVLVFDVTPQTFH